MKHRTLFADFLSADAKQACLDIARTIGERVERPDVFAEDAQSAHTAMPTRRSSDWGGGTIAGGHAGVAILMQALEDATGDERWTKAAYAHLLAASRLPVQSLGLYTGVSGLMFAARYCARGERYATMLSALARRIDDAAARWFQGDFSVPATVLEYDLIAGASGLALALSDAEETAGLERVRSYLEWVFAPVEPKRWACVTPGGPDREMRLNLGLAHGCAGAAAVLAMLGELETSVRLARLVSDHTRVHEGALQFASTLTFPDHHVRWEGRQIGWCYGNPGAALALFGVGAASGDRNLREFAVEAVTSLTRTPSRALSLEDCGLCHGTAGVALITGLFGAALEDPALRGLTAELVKSVVIRFDPSQRFGYRTWVLGGDEIDSPSFLEGAAGIATALLTVAGFAEPSWTRALGCPSALVSGATEPRTSARPISQLDFIGQEG